MKAYTRNAGDDLELHSAVLEVAATQKLSDGYQFDAELFFRNVRDVAARTACEETNAVKRSRGADKRSSEKRRKHSGND